MSLCRTGRSSVRNKSTERHSLVQWLVFVPVGLFVPWSSFRSVEEFQLQCLRCSIPQHIHECDGLAQVLASMSILLAFVPVSNARGGTLPRGFASIGRFSVRFLCEADRRESAIELRRAHRTFAWSVTSSASRRRGRSRPGDAPPRRSSVQFAMAGGVPTTLSCRERAVARRVARTLRFKSTSERGSRRALGGSSATSSWTRERNGTFVTCAFDCTCT